MSIKSIAIYWYDDDKGVKLPVKWHAEYYADGEYRKYTPVARFGENNCYDLNSFNRNDSTENIFVAFGNSNNKKTAETSVPPVIGSIFAYGVMAISGVAGMGLGMCIMSLIKRKKEN